MVLFFFCKLISMQIYNKLCSYTTDFNYLIFNKKIAESIAIIHYYKLLFIIKNI